MVMMGCIADDLSTRGALVPVLSTSQTVTIWFSCRYGTVRSNKVTLGMDISKRVPPICTADLHMAAD